MDDQEPLPDGSGIFNEDKGYMSSEDYLAEQLEKTKERWDNPREETIDGEVIR